MLLERASDDVRGLELGYHLVGRRCSVIHILFEERDRFRLGDASDAVYRNLHHDLPYLFFRRWRLGLASHAANPRDLSYS